MSVWIWQEVQALSWIKLQSLKIVKKFLKCFFVSRICVYLQHQTLNNKVMEGTFFIFAMAVIVGAAFKEFMLEGLNK